MWFLFISIQTNFHTINKRNCNLGEINWLSTLLFRGGKNAGDEPQSDSQTRQTAFHNQLQGKAICCCWKRRGKANIKPLLINWKNLKIAGSHIPTPPWLWVSYTCSVIHLSEHCMDWAVLLYIPGLSLIQPLQGNYVPRRHWSLLFYQTKETHQETLLFQFSRPVQRENNESLFVL